MDVKGVLAFTVLLVLTGELSGIRSRNCPRAVTIDADGPGHRKLRLVADGNSNTPCAGDLEACVFATDLKFYCLNGEKGARNHGGKLLGYSEVEVSPHYTTVKEHETKTSIGEGNGNNNIIVNIEIIKILTLNETKLQVRVICMLFHTLD